MLVSRIFRLSGLVCVAITMLIGCSQASNESTLPESESDAALELGSGENYWPLGGYVTAARERYRGNTDPAILDDQSLGRLFNSVFFGPGAESKVDEYGTTTLKRLDVITGAILEVRPSTGINFFQSIEPCVNEGTFEIAQAANLSASAQADMPAPGTESLVNMRTNASTRSTKLTDVSLIFKNCKLETFSDKVIDGTLRVYLPQPTLMSSSVDTANEPNTNTHVYVALDNFIIKTDSTTTRLTGVEKWVGPQDCPFRGSKTMYVYAEDFLTDNKVLYADFHVSRNFMENGYCSRDTSKYLPDGYTGWLYQQDLGAAYVSTIAPFTFSNYADIGIEDTHLSDRGLYARSHGQLELSGKDKTVSFSYLSYPDLYTESKSDIRAIEIALQSETNPSLVHRIALETFLSESIDNLTDTDNDGITDQWENMHGLDSMDSSDATVDIDNDGLTNIEEFLSWGVPDDSSDRGLRVDPELTITSSNSTSLDFPVFGSFQTEISNGTGRIRLARQRVLYTLDPNTNWSNIDADNECAYFDEGQRQILCTYTDQFRRSEGPITKSFSAYGNEVGDLILSAQLVSEIDEIDEGIVDAQASIIGVNMDLDYSLVADPVAYTSVDNEVTLSVSLTKSRDDPGSVYIYIDIPEGVTVFARNQSRRHEDTRYVQCDGNPIKYAFCEVIGMKTGSTLSLTFSFSAQTTGSYPLKWRIEGLEYSDNDVSNDVFESVLVVN